MKGIGVSSKRILLRWRFSVKEYKENEETNTKSTCDKRNKDDVLKSYLHSWKASRDHLEFYILNFIHNLIDIGEYRNEKVEVHILVM